MLNAPGDPEEEIVAAAADVAWVSVEELALVPPEFTARTRM